MDPDTAVERTDEGRDDDLEIQIDHVIVDLGDGAGDDEAVAREITAAILASLSRLDLEA
jgi:hypothetical protein